MELPLLRSILPSNEAHLKRAMDLIPDNGMRRVGLNGLAFKPGTDDLRESPIVIMAEALIGKGFKLAIHDSEVHLTRLTGANKRFLEEKLPHINSLLASSLADVVAHSKTLVVCKNAPEYAELPKLVAAHHVVDLVAALKIAGLPAAQYHGLYW